MDCLIKHSLSFVAKGLVKKLIEDVNTYQYLVTTEDWLLLVDLNEAVKDRRICINQCLGCLEFSRTVTMLLNFLTGIININKEYDLIITELCNLFNIPSEGDPIAMALDFVVSPQYVKSKISGESIAVYEKYVDAVKGEISRLASDYFFHEKEKCHDIIHFYGHLESEQIITYESIDRLDDLELFYVDQNVISKYGNDENFRRQIENFKDKVGCKFVYSPYVIEDGIKMSHVRLAEYFDTIEKLTEGTMLVRSRRGVALAKENIQITSDRVLLWRSATRAAEDLKVHEMHSRPWCYPHYSRGSPLSTRANKDIYEFLDSLRPFIDDESCDIDFNDYESDRAICRRLCAATIEKSFSLTELVDRSIKYEGDAECMRHIEHLCDFLDLINYQTEPLSDLNKIRSSLQDAEHLKTAWKANYFVTDDQKLRARGKFIYSALGLNTKFISIKDLNARIINEYKQ
jgi:hypothetical protein